MLGIRDKTDRAEHTRIFTFSGGSWCTWQKPAGVTIVHIYCLGGGGGGSSGAGSSSGNRSGGGGGASSGFTKAIFSANVLPDTLFVQAGAGGAGGDGTLTLTYNSGAAGGISYVSLLPSISSLYNVLVASGTAAGGGTNDTGGTAGAVWAYGSGAYSLPFLGLISVTAGQAGTNGSTITPSSVTISNVTTGGAGGSGTAGTSPGGSITGTGFIPTISGGAAGISGSPGVTFGFPGMNLDLYSSAYPFFFTGGAGGGYSLASSPGAGGNASFGCGGGGGGGGGNGTTIRSGVGGRGGDGLVIISAW